MHRVMQKKRLTNSSSRRFAAGTSAPLPPLNKNIRRQERSPMLNRILISAIFTGMYPVVLAAGLDEFVGTWEYEVSGVIERLELRRSDDTLQGIYFGMDFGGEKIPYYTATRVSPVILESGSVLSFVIPPRKIFGERPESYEEAEAMKGPGFTRSEMTMTGRLDGEILVLA